MRAGTATYKRFAAVGMGTYRLSTAIRHEVFRRRYSRGYCVSTFEICIIRITESPLRAHILNAIKTKSFMKLCSRKKDILTRAHPVAAVSGLMIKKILCIKRARNMRAVRPRRSRIHSIDNSRMMVSDARRLKFKLESAREIDKLHHE